MYKVAQIKSEKEIMIALCYILKSEGVMPPRSFILRLQ